MNKEKIYIGILVLVIFLSAFSIAIISSVDSDNFSKENNYDEESQSSNIGLIILENPNKAKTSNENN